MMFLGRAINPHGFRAAQVTAAYEAGASPRQMSELAACMNHSVETQERYYRHVSLKLFS
jgi:integrase